jgi:hypothetical protein
MFKLQDISSLVSINWWTKAHIRSIKLLLMLVLDHFKCIHIRWLINSNFHNKILNMLVKVVYLENIDFKVERNLEVEKT